MTQDAYCHMLIHTESFDAILAATFYKQKRFSGMFVAV